MAEIREPFISISGNTAGEQVGEIVRYEDGEYAFVPKLNDEWEYFYDSKDLRAIADRVDHLNRFGPR